MDKFEDFFKKSISSLRRENPTGNLPQTKIQQGTVGITRLNQRIVPDSATADMSLNPKIEQLRGSSSTLAIPISSIELKKILNDYNIKNLSKTSPRELGTTKIIVYYDESDSKFYLKRKQ